MIKKSCLFCCLVMFAYVNVAAQTLPADTISKTSVLQKVEKWYGDNMNYYAITTLMTIESSFVPFPSEIVIPPAVYVAGNPDSDLNVSDSYILNVLLIVFFGTLGAVLGAIINYLLALWLGRPIIYKFADSKVGHLCLLNSEKIQHAENYFNERGKLSTFIGRLVPGIRQLISIPAGLSKMNFLSFVGFTALGAGIWNIVLALLGYLAHGQADLINRYSNELSFIIIGIAVFAIVFLLIRKFIRAKR